MKTFALVLSTALCLTAFPALAQVTVGPGGVTLGDRDRDGDHERGRRDKLRIGEDRDRDRDHCRTVTVQEDGRTRTTRKCD